MLLSCDFTKPPICPKVSCLTNFTVRIPKETHNELEYVLFENWLKNQFTNVHVTDNLHHQRIS